MYMIMKLQKSKIKGCLKIPGSKSHTIRALFMASLAEGKSVIRNPLISDDTLSAVRTCQSFGAQISMKDDYFIVEGFGGKPKVPEDVINVGNSGTTLRISMMVAGLADGITVFTGDEQIRNRPLQPLIDAMNNLGASVYTTRGNGMAPVIVKGPLSGGETLLDAVTSQYLSSILISAPLLKNDTTVTITRLNEVPYVEMTLWWLDRQNIAYENDNFKTFKIRGRHVYSPMEVTIPGDFSSASFFLVLAAISEGELLLENLDMNDVQGDKQVVHILESMGAKIEINRSGIKIKGGRLLGKTIDMNAIPDALPILAVAGCFAEGETRLLNVPQARLKETDRIAVMYRELKKMGADIEELPDGLIVRKSNLMGCSVNGHGDHRIVMSLAVASLCSEGETTVDTAESVNVTVPEFPEMIAKCGGALELI